MALAAYLVMGLGTIGSQQRLNYNEKNDTSGTAKARRSQCGFVHNDAPKTGILPKPGRVCKIQFAVVRCIQRGDERGRAKKSPTGWQGQVTVKNIDAPLFSPRKLDGHKQTGTKGKPPPPRSRRPSR
jgi:hypothetical protein